MAARNLEKLSVVIPAYNQHRLTAVHVRECLNSNRIPDEIIVVNDGGPEDLREMLLELKPLPWFTRIIYTRINEDIPWNYNGAVNLGVWLSTGSLIAIEDTDHVPSRDAYENAIKLLTEDSGADRVHFHRRWTELKDVLEKPFEEWPVTGTIGPNQMVSIIRRDVYLKLKGQDERFCGQYGWMCYDWVMKYKQVLRLKSVPAHFYYIVRDGSEQGLKRGMSEVNRRIYRENANSFDQDQKGWKHSRHGILNFSYVYEIL